MKIYNCQVRGNIIGERLRVAREPRRLPQDAVAVRMEVEDVSISRKAVSLMVKGERFVADYELIFSQIPSLNRYWLLAGEGGSRSQPPEAWPNQNGLRLAMFVPLFPLEGIRFYVVPI